MRILLLIVAGLLVFKLIFGRWPWQPRISPRSQAILQARHLLDVDADAGRDDIISAHKRLIAIAHPDRGGSSERVHEANAARDLLLDQLPGRSLNHQEPS